MAIRMARSALLVGIFLSLLSPMFIKSYQSVELVTLGIDVYNNLIQS